MVDPAVLATGATGTVGAEVLRQLRHRGQAVRAAVSAVAAGGDVADTLIEPVHFDFTQPGT